MSLVVNKAQLMEIIKEEIQALLLTEALPIKTYGQSQSEVDEVPIDLGDDESGEEELPAVGGVPKWAINKAHEHLHDALSLMPDLDPGQLEALFWEIVSDLLRDESGEEITHDIPQATVAEAWGKDPTIWEKIAKDREAQAALNHLNRQQRDTLLALKDTGALSLQPGEQGRPLSDEDFIKLLKNPQQLNSYLDLIADETRTQYAEHLKKLVREVYSDKQRRWACAQADKAAGKRKKSLSKKEADEMCKGPKLKPKKKNRLEVIASAN